MPNCSLSRPINITNLCKLCTSMNSVSITWTVEVGKSHAVSIYLVENVTTDDLLNRCLCICSLILSDYYPVKKCSNRVLVSDSNF